VGPPPPAPAPALPWMQAASKAALIHSRSPTDLHKRQQQPQVPQDDRLRAGAAATAAEEEGHGWQLRSLQQVNSVFATPTYNPCTFCGPGCTTDRPGATSPQECSKCAGKCCCLVEAAT
jgi:hypothetical protein